MRYWARKYFTDPAAHKAALSEVISSALLSLAPFVITFFVESAKKQDGMMVSLDTIIGRGQLYLLTYAVFGTVIWLAFLKGDRPRHGARVFLGFIALLLILPVVGFLGVDPTFSTMLNHRIVSFGYWLYAAMLYINYLLLFYLSVNPPEASEILKRETGDMRDKLKEMKRNA